MKETQGRGLQVALDWLEKHGDDESAFVESSEPTSNAPKTCLKCNTCGKKFSAIEQAELHAARTSHDDFAEAILEAGDIDEIVEVKTEPTTPMTEEEKAARLAELRAKLAERRANREKESHQEELKRRTSAKELEEIRRELDLKEMKKLAEERKREKIDDRQRREEIKRQIEEDRAARKKIDENEKLRRAGEVHAEAVTAAIPLTPATSARIQIKLPAPATPLKFTFDSPSTTLLSDLKAKIEEATGSKMRGDLMQMAPPRTFTSADNDKTLAELELCPSASLQLK